MLGDSKMPPQNEYDYPDYPWNYVSTIRLTVNEPAEHRSARSFSRSCVHNVLIGASFLRSPGSHSADLGEPRGDR